MISIKDLIKSFGKKVVLDKVSLDITEGEKISIIGPSGCGKSTLLRLIIGLINPDAGSILIDDKDIAKINNEEDLIKLRQKISFVFQSSALFDSLNVYDNVAFSLHERGGISESLVRKQVKEKLALVGLEGTEKLMPEELSGGMQKRVGLARALAMNPQILLYDEPTTGLDPITSTSIEDLINKMAKELKVTTIIVTHQLSTINRVSDRIVMMHQGKFIEAGNPSEAKRSPNNIVRTFLNAGLL
ncbi:MAG: ABC transporter ATP-binding protein [bacterium]